MDAIYLDNAATSFPKPEGVSDRMKYYLDLSLIHISPWPSPARSSWRRGQPPSSTLPQPTSTMPSAFHRWLLWAMGCKVKPLSLIHI